MLQEVAQKQRRLQSDNNSLKKQLLKCSIKGGCNSCEYLKDRLKQQASECTEWQDKYFTFR